MPPPEPPVPLAVSSPAAAVACSAAPTQPAARECVSVPFTAPALIAVRARAATAGGLEMLLGNPAGGRGIHVARWPELRACGSPSLHDILLADRIEILGGPDAPLSPASMRAAAIDVAAEGHAGRRLARAAERARAAEQLAQRRLRAHLLCELARSLQLPGSEFTPTDPWSTDPQEPAGWLAGASELLAPRLDLPGPGPWQPRELSDAIAAIARMAAPLGFGPGTARAFLPRVSRMMQAVARTTRDGANPSGVAPLSRSIEMRAAEACLALSQARAWFDDPPALLAAWRADNATLARILRQPDWLLDGWDRLCLLSRHGVEIATHARALLDDGAIRPVLGWPASGCNQDHEAASSLSWQAGRQAGRQAGVATELDRLLWNEQVRLLELQLHDPSTDHSDAS